MREGRFSRYILYATGEILLIVAGILIAMQLNNWNRHSLSTTIVELQADESQYTWIDIRVT